MKIKDKESAMSMFEEAAIQHGDATWSGDYKTANRSYAIIFRAINFFKEHNELEVLSTFLNHESKSVRTWAATYLLPIKEADAIKTLKKIDSLDAETTLNEWRKGNLKL